MESSTEVISMVMIKCDKICVKKSVKGFCTVNMIFLKADGTCDAQLESRGGNQQTLG
jgi:hypothetical protein